MRPLETMTALSDFAGRGPGTDAERRAARWLAGELARSRRHRVRVETFWCRPNWALAHAWHVALAIVGGLISVGDPVVGTAVLAVALASMVADELFGTSLGRRLTPERASQNVIGTTSSTPPTAGARLIVTANYDAGRTGLIYRDAFRATAARLNRATGGRGPGWLAWIAIAITYELVIAVVRVTDAHPPGFLGVVQLPPTVALVLALALLLEAAGASYGPAAGDNGAGVAAAIALTRALAANPPHNLTVGLVLQGAGESQGLGLRRYLRVHKRELSDSNAIVLGIAACGAGQTSWWLSDGRLVPLRYASSLRALCAQTGAAPHRGRGGTPALPARVAGLPAIAIGGLDDRGLAPRSHQRADTVESLDEGDLDRTLELGLALAHAVDASIAPVVEATETTATPA